MYPLNDNGHKYLRVTLNRVGYYVHRLVAICFLKNEDPSKFNVIDHINGDARDNRACNLEWCTAKENMNHAYITGVSKRKLDKEKVLLKERR